MRQSQRMAIVVAGGLGLFVGLSVGAGVGSTQGFVLGQQDVRDGLRAIAEQATNDATNTFTRCLIEQWEDTGELSPEWRGNRGWALVERDEQATEQATEQALKR